MTTDPTPIRLSGRLSAMLAAALDFCVPRYRLVGTGYEAVWTEEARRRERLILRGAALIAAIGFALQYLVVDVPLELMPKAFWAGYRLGIAASFLSIALWLSTPTKSRLTAGRLLWMATAWSAVLLQAWGTVLVPKAPLVFSVFLCTAAAAVPPASGLVAATIFLGLALAQARILSPLSTESVEFGAQLLSLDVAGFCVLMIVKFAQIGQVQRFLQGMQEMERQRQIIDLQSDVVNQLRSFLPRVIFDRITYYKRTFRTTFEYATQEILRPRQTTVACLWSDIRGFTRASSSSDQYVTAVAAPNIRHLTDVSEAAGAIPRVIGDLLLCYYDEQDTKAALMNALTNAAAIVKANDRWNTLNDESLRVQRVVLLSWGQALVGNVGGSASSREITALGTCVNQLARLDEAVGSLFRAGNHSMRDKIIATTEFVAAARAKGITLDLEDVDLKEHGITVRDFPDVRLVHAIRRFGVSTVPVITDEIEPATQPTSADGIHEVKEAV